MKKKATIRDVAREANVSTATISYVLNGKESISAETRERVLEAIRRLEYVPSQSAQNLSTHTSRLIGVVIPQTEPGRHLMFGNPFYSEIISSIEMESRAHGYHIIISGTEVDESYLNLANRRSLDGIIIIGMYPDDFYAELKKANIPIVLVDSYCHDHYYHSVGINDRYGGYIATRHLIEHGHTRIGIMTGIRKNGGVVQMRYDGFCDAMKEAGLPIRKEWIYEGQVEFESGMHLAEQLAKQKERPTAVFAIADILAVGAVKRLTQLTIQVPADLSIIGFDDLDIARYISPGLTTIRQQIHAKGETAVRLLLNAMEDKVRVKQETILPLEIVERESVRRLNGTA